MLNMMEDIKLDSFLTVTSLRFQLNLYTLEYFPYKDYSCIFLRELNNMPARGTDISSAYLCATTSEIVCIEAGTEFEALSGHLLIIDKSLYGLAQVVHFEYIKHA